MEAEQPFVYSATKIKHNTDSHKMNKGTQIDIEVPDAGGEPQVITIVIYVPFTNDIKFLCEFVVLTITVSLNLLVEWTGMKAKPTSSGGG